MKGIDLIKVLSLSIHPPYISWFYRNHSNFFLGIIFSSCLMLATALQCEKKRILIELIRFASRQMIKRHCTTLPNSRERFKLITTNRFFIEVKQKTCLIIQYQFYSKHLVATFYYFPGSCGSKFE